MSPEDQLRAVRAIILSRIRMHDDVATRSERLADRYYRAGWTELYRDHDHRASTSRAASRVCAGILADMDILSDVQERTSCLKDRRTA